MGTLPYKMWSLSPILPIPYNLMKLGDQRSPFLRFLVIIVKWLSEMDVLPILLENMRMSIFRNP